MLFALMIKFIGLNMCMKAKNIMLKWANKRIE